MSEIRRRRCKTIIIIETNNFVEIHFYRRFRVYLDLCLNTLVESIDEFEFYPSQRDAGYSSRVRRSGGRKKK